MDIQLFDNFEDDGQLSMFDLGEDLENLQSLEEDFEADYESEGQAKGTDKSGQTAPSDKTQTDKADTKTAAAGYGVISGIRVSKCGSCGKILFVKEEEGNYISFCNNCGISYAQKM